MPVSIEDMLANTSLFSRVDRDELHQIAGWVQIQDYKPGQVIDREGDLGTTLHIIRSGSVDVYQSYESDDQTLLASFGEGDFFGEMALLLGRPRSATVVAKEETECLQILRNSFAEGATAPVLWSMLQHVAERLAHADETIGEMHSH
ncbi:MAG: cyclic nucleotide-binding domain-containing protein [Chloroflexota bacterium]|nr:cyclic nucleotide-binding domain-containing protein [Chloroflexota bacterium]MDE2892743.1 cyclic nucleotide-binding domain-containing protein [Chloroflexota bacterium]